MFEFIPFTYNDFFFFLQQYADRYTFLFPLGLIGLWRWSVWILKESVGLHYHPKTKEYNTTTSIVTPVYNENPQIFSEALLSWAKNRPDEIIAVIDHTDEKCIEIFRAFAKTYPGARLIITDIPGKRPALAAGIRRATGEIVALVDSDTIWSRNVIRNGLPPFHDPKVAGVATYQSVLNPKTFAQHIFDVQLDLRYRHEFPFLAACGNALVCLSGRTAFYRRYAILPLIQDLVTEKFLGKPVISGDDKRLTYLVLQHGWKVAYQSTSHVYTPGMKDFGSYLKQRLRWTRNSLRADLRAIFQGWPLRHPALLFFQIDKLLQSFVVVLSPIFFFVALYNKLWIVAAVIFCWWFASRTVKLYPAHLSHKPYNLLIIPGYVFYSFFTGIIKIYALFSLNTQGWITRWDKSRLPKVRFLQGVPAGVATVAVIMLLTYVVYQYKEKTYVAPRSQKQQLLAMAFSPATGRINTQFILGASSAPARKQLFTKKYETKKRESLSDIAKKFNIDKEQLFFANSMKLPNNTYALPGTTLSVPGKDLQLEPPKEFTPAASASASLTVIYDKKTNTLFVAGRGRKITLKDIQDKVGDEYIQEVSKGIWELKAGIYLYSGTTLVLDKKEVTWLRLESNESKFVPLRSRNGDILVRGVKITSWDSQLGDYDKNLSDGRSFIMVKDNARMDVYDSEFAYLGFPTSPDLTISPYGVSWKLSMEKLKKVLISGEVINSKFHNNYFGAYTYGATGMVWRGNEFYDNISYGFDPHDDSNGFLVENNVAHNNGAHGIIFSKRCMYNTIRNNISYSNKLHGIMLHEKSDFNVIENNLLTGNTNGVALWRSSYNIIRGNKIDNNRHGIRANVSSNRNFFQSNTIMRSRLYGFYFYDQANYNEVLENSLTFNNVGMYIKSDANDIRDNSLINNSVGIYFLERASGNVVTRNNVSQSKVYGIYTKVARDISNVLGYNTLFRNRKDIAGK